MIEIVTPWMGHSELVPAFEAAVTGARCIIIDQASDLDTAAALDAMVARLGNGSTVIRNEVNRHFAAANNQGLAAATGDVIVFLNNDIVGTGAPPTRWLEQVARDVRPGGLYGPFVRVFDVDGEPQPYVEGSCLAGYRIDFVNIGAWNAEEFPKAYAEDVELSWRARRNGLALYQAKWAIHHIGNVTSNTTEGAYAFADQQRERFREMVRASRRRAA